MFGARRTILALGAFGSVASSAFAQGPVGARTLSPAAVAESLAVLRQLDSTIAARPNDAAVWYRRGMLGWALADRARAHPSVRGLDWTLLGRLADTSLRIAAQIEPRNAHYRLMVGKYLLVSGVSITRFAAGGFFEDALTSARADTNGGALAEAAVENGRIYWRRYDSRADRRIETSPGAAIRSITDAAAVAVGEGELNTTQSLKGIRDALELTTQALPFDVAGGNDYERAELLFREAVDAAPGNPRAFQQLSMLLAARSRWTELERVARNQLRTAPWDGWAWMTLGLAMHRGSDSRAAAAAFDSAMTYLTKEERARLDRVERVLRAADTGVVTRGDLAERMATRRLYWMFADPLWSRDGNESRIEFLARVTFAELRWTVDELGVRGADTDRGDIFVRYGPPDVVASFGSGNSAEEGAGTISILWAYNSGLMFTFAGSPTFATARIPVGDLAYTGEVFAAQPVRWDNLTRMTIDSLPVQIARFRGGVDSVDVFLAATPDGERIKASSSVRVTPRADYWLLAGGTVSAHHDSARLSSAGTLSWTKRVRPGVYVYRVEASADAATVAARATAPLVAEPDSAGGFAVSGFGISDVLLASSVEPRGGVPKRRWTDFRVAPITGTIRVKGQLSLVWENYGFGERSAASEYSISVAIERERSGAGRVAARVVSRVTGTIGVQSRDDRMAVRFDRTMPHAPAIADFITLELGETPAGSYRLTLEVTDLISGQTATRSTRFVVK